MPVIKLKLFFSLSSSPTGILTALLDLPADGVAVVVGLTLRPVVTLDQGEAVAASEGVVARVVVL